MRFVMIRQTALVAVLVGLVVVAFMAFGEGIAGATFGVLGFDGQLSSDVTGDVYTQAGGHPYAFTTQVEFNHHLDPVFETQAPDAPTKDIYTSLPAGLIGNPGALPRCSATELSGAVHFNGAVAECPMSSQIGVIALLSAGYPLELPLYNMQPPPSLPAELGFNFFGVTVVLGASVRSNGDYGVDIKSRDISEGLPFTGLAVTVWGTPGDSVHDGDRCRSLRYSAATPSCLGPRGEEFTGPNSTGLSPQAYLSLPTRCTAPGEGLEMRLRTDSWDEPGVFQTASFLTHEAPGFPSAPDEWGAQIGTTGCDRVPFEPSVAVSPTSTAPDAPTGLDVTMSMPQESLTTPAGVAQSDLRSAVITLPEGMAVNPSSADGLGACSAAQIGLGSDAAAACPDNSRIGTVSVATPLLEAPLTGGLYLARQNENPFGSLLAVYLVAEGSGVVVKLPGKVDADPVTGRLKVTFDETPQLPFSELSVQLKSGPRAPLVNPSSCGPQTVTSELTGWSGKTVTLTSGFTVDCAAGLGGFSPSFVAGTTSNQAGAFSPLVLSFSRQDGEQNLAGLSTTLAPGLLAKIAGVPRCSDQDAAAGSCPDASRIGSVLVGAGAGSNPYLLHGSIYLTGPYNGGAFGDSVVVPAVAGPFNLGNVVVRSSIRIDPHTSQVTVVSDPFPQILQGIPVALRRVDVTLDRPNLTFNPTSCEPVAMPATITSSQGTSVQVSSRFQAAGCAALVFKPSFKVSTRGRTTRAGGASLDVTLASAPGQANIAKVAVKLPKQLPSWLPTLRQACTEATFAANPAACPAGSQVGSVTATTPVLASPLTGPAYLVSHGGAAFPDLVLVLQGEGVTVQVVGATDIKGGVTSSTFNAVPDVPIGSVHLTLPQGPNHALAVNLPESAKGNLCGQKLTMPTTITGQNGAQIKQNTKIAIAGCSAAKHKHRVKHKSKHHRKAGAGRHRTRKG